MSKAEERIKEIESEMRAIDQKVANLERANDSYIASHGHMNSKIYNEINQLMDKREELFIEHQALNSAKV